MFWHILRTEVVPQCDYTISKPESELVPIPARPSTAEIAEDLLVDPEALKFETHEPGIYDENGDYIPQYSDDPKDLEHISPTPLDAPSQDDTAPESSPADVPPPSSDEPPSE